MTTFEQLRAFLNLFSIGEIITRKEILEVILTSKPGGEITIDNYRNWFTKAGYLKWISRGKYQLICYPPTGLTSRDLRKKAYPDWKYWNEYSYLKNHDYPKSHGFSGDALQGHGTISSWEEANGRGFWGSSSKGYIYDKDNR